MFGPLRLKRSKKRDKNGNYKYTKDCSREFGGSGDRSTVSVYSPPHEIDPAEEIEMTMHSEAPANAGGVFLEEFRFEGATTARDKFASAAKYTRVYLPYAVRKKNIGADTCFIRCTPIPAATGQGKRR